MTKWCLNYDSGEYEHIDKDGFSIDRGEKNDAVLKKKRKNDAVLKKKKKRKNASVLKRRKKMMSGRNGSPFSVV